MREQPQSRRGRARAKRIGLFGPPKLLSTADVAYLLAVGEPVARNLMERGVIPSRRKGNGTHVVFRTEFERWLDKIEVTGCPELDIPPCGRSNHPKVRAA